MKRIICLLLCAIFTLTLVSCSDKKKKKEVVTYAKTTCAQVTSKDKVRKAVEKGELTGAMYKIGTHQFTIENDHKDGDKKDDEGHLLYLDMWYDEFYTHMNLGKYTYIFENPKMSEGVSIIVSMHKAFGFEANVNTSNDVAFNLGAPDVIDVPANEDLFFMVSIPDAILRYTYNFGDKRVDFIFDGNGILMTTVLTSTSMYGKFGQTRTGTEMFTEAS